MRLSEPRYAKVERNEKKQKTYQHQQDVTNRVVELRASCPEVFKGSAWIRYQVDGQSHHKGELKEGEQSVIDRQNISDGRNPVQVITRCQGYSIFLQIGRGIMYCRHKISYARSIVFSLFFTMSTGLDCTGVHALYETRKLGAGCMSNSLRPLPAVGQFAKFRLI